MRSWFVFALSLISLIQASCATLPEYARPRSVEYNDPLAGYSDGFTYRELTRADFEASESSNYKEHLGSVKAQSCISIRPGNEVKGTISKANHSGKTFYVGSISDFRLEAVFVPGCSWWNPEMKRSRYPYVLEHEQVHFAISQYWAERGTVEIGELLRREVLFGDSPVEVKNKISEMMHENLAKIREQSVQMHTEFDEDCSLFFDPEKQKEWLTRIVGQLKELENQTRSAGQL